MNLVKLVGYGIKYIDLSHKSNKTSGEAVARETEMMMISAISESVKS